MEKEILHIIDMIAVLAFAISGALTAMRNKMDIVGIFIVAFITSLGGGTIRDLLIGINPVSWVSQTEYLWIIFIGVVFTILFRKKAINMTKSMLFFDSVGLGIFVIYGVEISIEHNLSNIIAITMGTVTGTFGGVTRDIICNDIPVVFRSEIYASVCVVAGILYLIFAYLNVPKGLIYFIIPTFVVVTRWIIVKYRLSLPSIYSKEETGEEELF